MIDNKNYIIAIVLSVVILITWQLLFVPPEVPIQQDSIADIQESQSIDSDVPLPLAGQSTTGDSPTPGIADNDFLSGTISRDTALKSTERISISTPKLNGSINLVGARIDDLELRDYHTTVDSNSPIIKFFSPQDTNESYYSQHGWSARSGSNTVVPNSETHWIQTGNNTLSPGNPIKLTWDNENGLIFERIIEIDEYYMLTVTQSVKNNTAEYVELFPYGLVSRKGEPDISGFFILHEGFIGFFGEQGLSEIDYDDVAESADRRIRGTPTSQGWIGITDKYWTATLIPINGSQFQPEFKYIEKNDTYQANFIANEPVLIAPNSTSSYQSLLYAGAKVNSLLQNYSTQYGIDQFDLLIDWGWFYFITKPMFIMIDWFYNLVGNFGVAILLATVVIKIIFFPLANKSYVSMSRMKLVQPQMTEIRERHKNDKQAQQKAMMELYKKEKINPLAGCLPIVIQIPVFFALYKVLFVTIEMRHAPFIGWIRDLSAPDPTSIFNLFGLIPWDPPQLLLIGVCPLLMGLTMFIQMKMNPTPTEPAQQIVFNWMPVVFTFMLASFPAGLVIYWIWNNLLSIIQQYVIMRRQGVKIELWDNLKNMIKPKIKSETGKT